MSRSRLAALAALASSALVLGSAAPAVAQTPKLTQKVSVTGTQGFTGTYTIERFVRAGGKHVAVGTLRGTLRGERVRRENVRMPATLAAAQTARAAQIPGTPGACQILRLVLEPIDLNLLGLRVRTSRIELLIEGIPGPATPGPAAGGLLGNLLCTIANVMLPAPPLQQTQLLNAALALSPRA